MIAPTRYLEKRRILVVDSDEQGCTFFRRILLAAGIPNELTSCRRTSEAECHVEAPPAGLDADEIGLVFVNLDLPDAEALQWVQRLRQKARFSRTAVIGLTGNLDEDGAGRARPFGVDAVLEKYPGPATLRSVTARALRERTLAARPGPRRVDALTPAYATGTAFWQQP